MFSLYFVSMLNVTFSSSEISYRATGSSSLSSSYFMGSGSSNERLSISLYLLLFITLPIIFTPLNHTFFKKKNEIPYYIITYLTDIIKIISAKNTSNFSDNTVLPPNFYKTYFRYL